MQLAANVVRASAVPRQQAGVGRRAALAREGAWEAAYAERAWEQSHARTPPPASPTMHDAHLTSAHGPPTHGKHADRPLLHRTFTPHAFHDAATMLRATPLPHASVVTPTPAPFMVEGTLAVPLATSALLLVIGCACTRALPFIRLEGRRRHRPDAPRQGCSYRGPRVGALARVVVVVTSCDTRQLGLRGCCGAAPPAPPAAAEPPVPAPLRPPPACPRWRAAA